MLRLWVPLRLLELGVDGYNTNIILFDELSHLCAPRGSVSSYPRLWLVMSPSELIRQRCYGVNVFLFDGNELSCVHAPGFDMLSFKAVVMTLPL